MIVVGVDCDSSSGLDRLSAASVGLTGGPYDAELDPNDGSITLQVLPDGRGVSAFQSTLDAPSYTATFAEIDGGVSFEFDGCAS